LFCLILFLSFCHAKATVALYFGRIRARQGELFLVSGCFFDFFSANCCLFEATKQR